MTKVTNRLLTGAVVLIVLQGCAQQGYSVIATTGTTIGVEVGQDASGGFTGVLGYRRAEFALVPSNRPAEKDESANGQPAGADQTGDVIMELRYTGFSEAGIYQRLAVGRTAVSQPGAQIMFAKNAKGEVDPDTANALRAIQGVPVTADDVRVRLHRMTQAYGSANAATRARFDAIVKNASGGVYANLGEAALNSKHMSSSEAEAIEKALSAAGLL